MGFTTHSEAYAHRKQKLSKSVFSLFSLSADNHPQDKLSGLFPSADIYLFVWAEMKKESSKVQMWSLVGCVLPPPCLYFLSWFFLCHAPLKQKCLKIISMETCNNSRWVYVPRFEFSVWAASLVDLQMCRRCSPCEQRVGAAKEVQTAAPQKSNDPHEDADFSFCSACQPRRFASPVNSSANFVGNQRTKHAEVDWYVNKTKKTLVSFRSAALRNGHVSFDPVAANLLFL